MGPVRRGVREVGLALITLGVVILLFVAYQLFGTGIAEAHSQSNLKKSFLSQVATHDVPTVTVPGPTPTTNPNPSTPGAGAIDHLVIPKIGVDKFVVQGVGEEDLRRGPGHYPNTVMPGQIGNAAIAGHRTTYGAPFYRLNELSPGDDILITDTDGKTFDYKVTRTFVVNPSDISVLDPTPIAQLTLTTCNPRFSAAQRLIVTAGLTALQAATPPPPTTVAPAAAQTGKAVATPPVDNLGKGESKAWPPAILYGLAVIALWILARLAINRTRRWQRAGAYLLGIGVCLIPLWFCFENVVLLLPQNI